MSEVDVAIKGAKALNFINGNSVKSSELLEKGLSAFFNPTGKINKTINPMSTINQAAEGYVQGMGLGNSLRYSALNGTSREEFLKQFGEKNIGEAFSNAESAKAMQKELDDFFDNAQYDKLRTGLAAVTVGSTAYRVASGGGLYRDSNGNFNIIGVPGI